MLPIDNLRDGPGSFDLTTPDDEDLVGEEMAHERKRVDECPGVVASCESDPRFRGY